MGIDRYEDRVAVWPRLRGLAGADVAAGPDDILDIELSSEALRQLLCDKARANIGRPAGRERHDYSNRLGWIILRKQDIRVDHSGQREHSHR
jgi:hypothetical protein